MKINLLLILIIKKIIYISIIAERFPVRQYPFSVSCNFFSVELLLDKVWNILWVL